MGLESPTCCRPSRVTARISARAIWAADAESRTGASALPRCCAMRCSRASSAIILAMAKWTALRRRLPSTSAIRILWWKRSYESWGNEHDANRSSGHRGEVAGGSPKVLREAGADGDARGNRRGRKGAAGDGSGGREPHRVAGADVTRFSYREVSRKARRGTASRGPACERPGGHGGAPEGDGDQTYL